MWKRVYIDNSCFLKDRNSMIQKFRIKRINQKLSFTTLLFEDWNLISQVKSVESYPISANRIILRSEKSMIHHHNIVLVNHRKVDSTFHRSGNSYRNPILNDQIRQCQIPRPRYRTENSPHRSKLKFYRIEYYSQNSYSSFIK